MVRVPTNEVSSTDSTQASNNYLYVTQAINTGAAVNSFIVDWQVPMWATATQTLENALLANPNIPTGRVDPDISQVFSGVWEMPGTSTFMIVNPVKPGDPYETSQGTHYFDQEGNEVGAWRVDTTRPLTHIGTGCYPYFVNEDNDYAGTEGNVKYDDYQDAEKENKLRYVTRATAYRVDVNTPEAAAAREIEDKLYVLVYVRRASDNLNAAVNGFNEQNGAAFNPRENYSVPGTDADRDYFYGEDDAADPNTAGMDGNGWEYVGYSKVSSKQNKVFDNISKAGTTIRQVRWVIRACDTDANGRPIITDETLSHEVPVPTGFRLAVDADTDTVEREMPDTVDPKRNNTGWSKRKDYDEQIIYKYVSRNLGNVNYLDPAKFYKIGPNEMYFYGEVIETEKGDGGRTLSPAERAAALKGIAPATPVGGDDCWDRTMQGDLIVREHQSQWVVGSPMPQSVSDNAAGVRGGAFITELPVVHDITREAALYGTRGVADPAATPGKSVNLLTDASAPAQITDMVATMLGEAGADVTVMADGEHEGEDPDAVRSDSVHVNHFATVVPRYDDTKYASFERSRAGFFRSEEKPTIKVDVKQWYFSGTPDSGYRWLSDGIMLDPEDSLFLRYEITLYNMSEGQLRLLGYDAESDGFSVDSCTNPSISALLPRIQNYGPTAGTMLDELPALNANQQKRMQLAAQVRAIGAELTNLQTIEGEAPEATQARIEAIAKKLEALCGKAETDSAGAESRGRSWPWAARTTAPQATSR